MTSAQRVRNTILGKPVDRQPIYGWVIENLEGPIREHWGSVAAFEDHYEFDMAHIFGGPAVFNQEVIEQIRQAEGSEVPPDVLLEHDCYLSPDHPEDYLPVRQSIAASRIWNLPMI